MLNTMKQKALVLALSVSVMAGCSSTATQEDGEYAPIDQSGGSQVYGGGSAGDLSSTGMSGDQQGAGVTGEAALRDVRVFYFDFDRSDVKPEHQAALNAHARFMAMNPGVRIVLEGHGDERGTQEYNLALGERRANAVQRYLLVNGAARNQIEVVSYGEERPAAFGRDEASYAKNRRVELVYK